MLNLGKSVLLSLAISLGALGGCASTSLLQTTSAGYVGCPPEEIVITNEHTGFASRAWQATCRTRTYQCSNYGSAMACSMLQAPAAVAYPMSAPAP